MSFYIESLIIGIGLLVFIDFVLIVHQDPNFYGEGSIIKALPSWKGKKKLFIYRIVYHLSRFINVIVFIILYLSWGEGINQTEKMACLGIAFWIPGIILAIINEIFFHIQKRKEDKHRYFLDTKF